MGKSKRVKGYCLTINNYTDEDMAQIIAQDYKYCIVGFEGKGKTEHMQVYLYHHTLTAFSIVKELYPTAHIEAQKGTDIEALVYCMKEGDYWETGDRPRQGRRTDLDIIQMEMKYGKKRSVDIAEDYFSRWVQYRRSFDEYERMHREKKDTWVCIYDPYNPSSCKEAVSKATEASNWYKNTLGEYNLWVDFYSGRYDIIFVSNQLEVTSQIKYHKIKYVEI